MLKLFHPATFRTCSLSTGEARKIILWVGGGGGVGGRFTYSTDHLFGKLKTGKKIPGQ